MNRYIIVGANFTNKGAQSMLFITVDEIKKRFPDSEIYFTGSSNFPEQQFTFKQIYDTAETRQIALGGAKVLPCCVKMFVKDLVKTFLGRKNNVWCALDLHKVIPTADAIIDVSGFAIGEKWEADIQERYLDYIRLAKKYNIPMYIMPQSFGPFQYSNDKKYLLDDIGELLKYPTIIYAREKEGEKLLKDAFHLSNVKSSFDLVLQNTGVDLSNIYTNEHVIDIPAIIGERCVAIIPNAQCFVHGDSDKNYGIYESLIRMLLAQDRNVYIIRHSNDDVDVCRKLKEKYSGDEKVKLLNEEYDCIDFDELVKRFEFVICSRYHGIVHAYRNGIPCVALGWAIKYKELACKVNQEKYAIDITSPEVGEEYVCKVVEDMMEKYKENGCIISEAMNEIRMHNCFDILCKK